MLRLLVIVSGAIEIVFGTSIFLATRWTVATLFGVEPDTAATALAQLLGAATLTLGMAAILARNELKTESGRGIAYGLTVYNVLAALTVRGAVAAGLGGSALWIAGGIHAAIGAILIYLLLMSRGSPARNVQSS
jgi:hypothetical protein